MKYALWLLGLIGLAVVGIVVYQYTPRVDQESNMGIGEGDTVQIVLTKMTDTDMEFVYVDREIPKTNVFEDMVKSTLEALIAGPTMAEKAQGLSVAFNAGTKVNYVRVMGSVLLIDFNSKFDTPMGGSAKVRSIAQSVDRTIRQFPIEGIGEIQFTINDGEREAVLEP